MTASTVRRMTLADIDRINNGEPMIVRVSMPARYGLPVVEYPTDQVSKAKHGLYTLHTSTPHPSFGPQNQWGDSWGAWFRYCYVRK